MFGRKKATIRMQAARRSVLPRQLAKGKSTMDVRNRHSFRRLTLCFAVPAGLLLMAILAPAPAAAQGTPQQRAACEGDAMRLCSAHVPDVDRITACMSRNRRNLSAGCRAVFDGGSKRRARTN
jgi:hypothetical protein